MSLVGPALSLVDAARRGPGSSALGPPQRFFLPNICLRPRCTRSISLALAPNSRGRRPPPWTPSSMICEHATWPNARRRGSRPMHHGPSLRCPSAAWWRSIGHHGIRKTSHGSSSSIPAQAISRRRFNDLPGAISARCCAPCSPATLYDAAHVVVVYRK